MSDITQQEIVEALDRAQALKEMSEEFINVAGNINDAVERKLEEERGIDIDSNRWIPLDDIPFGEEVIRVKDELPTVESAISTLEFIVEGKVSVTELGEKFQGVIDDLDNVEGTLQDVCAEDIIKAQEGSDEDFNGY
ncbi:hypothetical protein ABRP59_19220 [Pectobacterium punjabense]|uniref:hypothetical protein n=1 Tax=Pectobacterium punjabense TaxID=2108399 RepID=UPI0032EE327C